jgi:imidazolonepropionase-like amidohydrolase
VDRRDYGAATIVPGLVDAHTHLVAPGDGTLGDEVAREDDDILLLQAAQNARTLLHSGVTTLRENGAKGRVAFSLREGIRRKLAPGPRMVICGRPITITGGHMGYFGSEADGESAVRAEVRKLLKEGADYIKIVASGGSTRTSDPNRASYTVPELAAMTDEARRHGKLTAAHCTSAQSVQNCLDAGVDMIIHCIFSEPDGTYRFRPDLVERLVAAKAWVNPTLYVMKAGIDRQREARAREGRLTPELAGQLDQRLPGAAAELVRLGVDVILTSLGEPGIRAPKQATSTISIVMVPQCRPRWDRAHCELGTARREYHGSEPSWPRNWAVRGPSGSRISGRVVSADRGPGERSSAEGPIDSIYLRSFADGHPRPPRHQGLRKLTGQRARSPILTGSVRGG